MKKTLFSLLACAAMTFAFSSCNDTMDDKADVEAGWHKAEKPAATLSLSGTTFSSTDASMTVSDTTDVLEYGVQYSTAADFATSEYAAADGIDPATSFTLSGLADNTTYYLRSYIVTRSNGTILGDETRTITTPVAPIFTIEGTYAAADFVMNEDDGSFAQEGDSYEVSIAFVEGSSTEVKVTNLMDGEETLTGTYDADNQTITIDAGKTLFEHPNYGDCYETPVDDDLKSLDKWIISFTPKGGALETSLFSLDCSAGQFGYYIISMNHK